MGRIQSICSYLEKCASFADVGCDHGYCAEYMLKNKLCDRAVISDISEKCLAKAEKLLISYIRGGLCKPVCCDGLEGIDRNTDLVLIAGMGGEEIVKILKNSFIPNKFVFQPMKNSRELRAYLIDNGCSVSADDIFKDGDKFYFIIKGSCGGSEKYIRAQLEFGRDSLKNPLLKQFLAVEISKKNSYLNRAMSDENRAAITSRINFLQSVLENETC